MKNNLQNGSIANRFYGIDLLRMIAITGVVMLHTLRRSGLLSSDIISQYQIAWLIEIVFYFSVDAFGIVSGFVGYSSKEKPLKISNIMKLWVQVFFYGIITVILFSFCSNDKLSVGDILTAAFPLIRGEYWFFSAYFGMFLCSIIINKAVRNTKSSGLYKMVAVGFLFFSCIETIIVKLNANYSLFSLENGYSFVWLSLMYFVGATIRKTECYKCKRPRKILFVIAILGLDLFTWGWMVYIGPLFSTFFPIGQNWNRLFVEYISPTIVCIAALIVMMFADLEISRSGARKIISLIAPTAFSIYLINSQPLIAKYIYNREHLSFLLDLNSWKLVGAVLLTCITFTFSGIIIDLIRLKLFGLFKINQIFNKVDNYIIIGDQDIRISS